MSQAFALCGLESWHQIVKDRSVFLQHLLLRRADKYVI
ncbi:uncharacterized protein FFFS_16057 [Fusarium fujikuroi]|nr:uncharacterized protein FFFS_16057 [Fusarium fujikuroi]